MPDRPRLLMATHLVPVPVDMACKLRIVLILRHLARRFHVTLVSLSQGGESPGDLEALTGLCNRFVRVPAPNKRSPAHKAYHRLRTEASSLLSGVPADYFYANVPQMERALRETLRDHGPFDAVMAEYWYASDYLSRVRGPLKIVDTHDVDHLKNEEMRRNLPPSWARLALRIRQRNGRRREAEVLGRYDLVVAITEPDRAFFRQWLGDRKELVLLPTGLDTDRLSPPREGREPDPRRITFFGAMQGQGNVQAALFFHEEIFPRILREVPEARFMILGSHPPESILALGRRPRVEVTGYVPDVKPYLEGSAVVVCPFRMGYGFRGRVLEPMALEVPVVSTSIGVGPMGLRDGEGILLRDTPGAFAEAVVRLLRNPAEAAALGRRGRQAAVERFSLEATYGRFADTLLERIARKKGETP